MTRARVVAGVACVLAALAVAAVLVPWPDPALRARAACPALAELSQALTLDSIGDQAVVRSRAAALADALARGEGQELGSPAARHEVAQRISALLDDPEATIDDLVIVLRPVATACGHGMPVAAR
ncbi:MAG TPA: hypothetical protein VF143_09770 [Candidatus Nanopelagicales bacterium]